MRKTLPILIAVSTVAASCSTFGRLQPGGHPVGDVAGAGPLAIVEPSPLRMPKQIPVLSPPEVFSVYVPSHVDRAGDLLIGEHWVFFKLSESEWFTEKRRPPAPPAVGPATEAQLAPLRSLDGFERAVTPYRESKP